MDDNKDVARVWLEQVMNEHDVAAIDRAYSPDYIYRGPGGHVLHGRDKAKETAAMLIEAVPDRVATVHEQVAEGDRVATRWSSRGTNTGPLFGRAPTGREVVVEGLTITTVRDGRIVSDWEILQVQHDEE